MREIKPKYRVAKRIAEEFGRKSKVFVIEKRTWLGFYWPTMDYFTNERAAEEYKNRMNRRHIYNKMMQK